MVTDGRDADRLADVRQPGVVRVAGDIADPSHRAALVAEVERLGRLDLLVHNASTLGPLPLRPLRELTGDDLAATWAVNADRTARADPRAAAAAAGLDTGC